MTGRSKIVCRRNLACTSETDYLAIQGVARRGRHRRILPRRHGDVVGGDERHTKDFNQRAESEGNGRRMIVEKMDERKVCTVRERDL